MVERKGKRMKKGKFVVFESDRGVWITLPEMEKQLVKKAKRDWAEDLRDQDVWERKEVETSVVTIEGSVNLVVTS